MSELQTSNGDRDVEIDLNKAGNNAPVRDAAGISNGFPSQMH